MKCDDNGERLNLSPKIQNKARMSSLTTPIQPCTASPSQCNKARKINKRHTDWKGKNKNKTAFVSRQHGCLHRKFQRIYKKKKKNPRTNK